MWLAIAALILAGVVLIIVEVVFIPGTTVVGILGLVFTIIGIVVSYGEFGREGGSYVLLGTGIFLAGALYYSFRKGAWKKFSLKTSIDSRVNEGAHADLKVGTEGVAVSALRPMGTAEFQGKMVEVKTNGDYLAAGTRVKIIQIQTNDIVVEPIN
ncbi:MAG TPA: NfeD family protein [Cyclobacteriaceae bacterium]|nr:NfeD family protein [Cyclobacteriaceae bacterium]HRJ81826.1 NfeD family protein [Cyclobacteriaceae bacterium]